jgi:DnaA family protein
MTFASRLEGQRYNSPVKQLVLDLIPTPAPSLANFVAGQNIEALAAIGSIVEPSPGFPAKIVYLWGAPGCGKSHLLSACKGLGLAPLESAGPTPVEHRYAVDNVQQLSEDAQQRLFDLINRQHAGAGALIASGNVAPRDLALRRDLASRLGSGLVFQLHPLTDSEKAAALHAHAKSRGFMLREPVVGYLLRHSRRDMASLIQLLNALDQYSLETGREITLPLLKEMSQPSLV